MHRGSPLAIISIASILRIAQYSLRFFNSLECHIGFFRNFLDLLLAFSKHTEHILLLFSAGLFQQRRQIPFSLSSCCLFLLYSRGKLPNFLSHPSSLPNLFKDSVKGGTM